MKISFDPQRHFPLGRDWRRQRNILAWGLAMVVVMDFSVLAGYFSALDALYEYSQTYNQKFLVPGRVIVPFSSLISEYVYLGHGLFAILALLLAAENYLYHYQGSRSIYLMKRLPRRSELHRRCWFHPLLGCAVAALTTAALLALFYIIYRTWTPAQCLPG